ncbi:MAG TPA: ASPIC/UnbV domain-containing protein, partial [Urbifossiella sp.]|nr:ASPIC/UnbV domain-containing protein [Urbifossiella sp.]
VDVAAAVGATDTYDGRAVALGDFFNRGVADVAVATQGGPFLLYTNTVAPGRDWVQFRLTGSARPGREAGRSNRDAVGTEVRLTWRQGSGPPTEQVQVVTAGDGYAAQTMSRLHFGLGTDAVIEKAVIKWPSGRTQTVAAPRTGALHSIEETGP